MVWRDTRQHVVLCPADTCGQIVKYKQKLEFLNAVAGADWCAGFKLYCTVLTVLAVRGEAALPAAIISQDLIGSVLGFTLPHAGLSHPPPAPSIIAHRIYSTKQL